MNSASGEPLPSGLSRRRARISDEETERRMLRTASAELARSGLTVSLEHIRLEDIIRDAGVSRSAVYRRWPHKDLFLGDMLLELARASAPLNSPDGSKAAEAVKRLVGDHPQWLSTADGRWRLIVQLLRETAALDFGEIHQSSQWRTYLALTVTFISLPPGELREQVQQALSATEQTFTDRIARGYRMIARLFGLRLRPSHDVSFETVAQLGNAMMRGLVIKTLAAPDLASERITGAAFDVKADWSLPELGLTGVITSYLEPDPDIEWNAARIRDLKRRLSSSDDLFEDDNG